MEPLFRNPNKYPNKRVIIKTIKKELYTIILQPDNLSTANRPVLGGKTGG